MKIEKVYEDSDILVTNKPPGLVVDRETMQTEDRLVVHRLDKDTSGLLIFAKTPEALENLQKQFKERKVKKGYLALVHGRVGQRSGVINKPVGRNPKDGKKFAVVSGGREAVTKYRVRKLEGGNWKLDRASSLKLQFQPPASSLQHPQTGENLTLLDVEPLTGRTHQIRVHLKSIGHPVVGDELYASRRQIREDEKIINRQFLHAYRLGFEHPRAGEWLVFEAGLPQDLQGVLDKLKTQNSNFKTTS